MSLRFTKAQLKQHKIDAGHAEENTRLKYDPPAEAIIQAWALENFGAFSRIHVFPFPHVLPSDGSCSADDLALSCPVDWQPGQGSDFHPKPSV